MVSEKIIPSTSFKIKLGTLNKKNPRNFYLKASTYIKAKAEKASYDKEINAIDKELKALLKQEMAISGEFNNRFLLVTEVPTARISSHRKVHYNIEAYFNNPVENGAFGESADYFINKYASKLPEFRELIENHGFVCTKSKL